MNVTPTPNFVRPTPRALDCIIRGFTGTDRAFVADAWLNSLRAGTEETRRADWDAFKAHHNAAIDRILDDAATVVSIAAPAGDDLTIYGFLVRRPGAFHMLFVKKPWRRMGVAKRLLDGAELDGAVFTQWTRDVGEWILPRFMKAVGRDRFGKQRFEGGMKYNPFFGSGS